MTGLLLYLVSNLYIPVNNNKKVQSFVSFVVDKMFNIFLPYFVLRSLYQINILATAKRFNNI